MKTKFEAFMNRLNEFDTTVSNRFQDIDRNLDKHMQLFSENEEKFQELAITDETL